MIRLLAIGAALALAAAAFGAPAPTAPLLAWGDDPPATEVRPLSGPRTVVVRYGAIAPVTFFAELDGDPVTVLFHPAPNTSETVALPFIGGRNALRIGASAADDLAHIVLERAVVFARLPVDADADPATLLRSAPELRHELWKKETPEAPPRPADAPGTTPPATTPTTGAAPTGR